MKLINSNRPFPTDIFRFFDDPQTRLRTGYRPAVNIMENDDAYTLQLLAPGRNKDLFKVDFYDGVLEISYTTETNGEEATPNYRRHEFTLADFTRRFRLDEKVLNDEAIEATYENGVLTLTLPKREEAVKQVRQIAVA